MIKKNIYIAETAARILAAMCASPEKIPLPQEALQLAEELWQSLEDKAYPDTFGRIGAEK